MIDALTRTTSKSVLRSLAEPEMAAWLQQNGVRIVQHQGRYWREVRRGFYQSVHWLARLTAKEAAWPTSMCWGFRTSLQHQDESEANAAMPVHLNENIEQYELSALSSRRRRNVRNGLRHVEIVEVLHPDVMGEDAHAAHLSSVRRTGYGRPMNWSEFSRIMRDQVRPDLRIVLAGRVNGKIGGYVTASAVEETGYIDSVILATEALPTNIGTALIFELMQICRRSGIREVAHGLHSREDATLSQYKEEMGFPVVRIPARAALIPGLEHFVRWRHPHFVYRLFG